VGNIPKPILFYLGNLVLLIGIYALGYFTHNNENWSLIYNISFWILLISLVLNGFLFPTLFYITPCIMFFVDLSFAMIWNSYRMGPEMNLGPFGSLIVAFFILLLTGFGALVRFVLNTCRDNFKSQF